MDPLTIRPRNTQTTDSVDASLVQDEEHHEQRQETKNTEGSNFFVEVFKFAFLAFLIVVPFRLYIAQPFIVSGASMSPTFETGEYLIVDQVSYKFEKPHRGDVVIFRFPNEPSKFFIKRIIGLPGEVVELANGTTKIIPPDSSEEIVLDEEYLVTDKTDDHLSITLSPDEYFVMGDNRSKSSDSRDWGPVPEENIVGRALVRLLPLQTISLFPGSYSYSYDLTPELSTAE